MTAIQTTRPYFEGLNALRFMAAFAIFLLHQAPNASDFLDKNTLSFHVLSSFFWKNLSVGVDLFFIISGFLITFLLLHEKETNRKIDFLSFYKRRALRIFPLYFFIVGISFLQYRTTNPETDFLSYSLFLGNFALLKAHTWPVSLLIPLWSLSIEEHFYLIIPFFIQWLSPKKVAFFFGFLFLISIGFRTHTFLNNPTPFFVLYAHTLSRCDELLMGCLLALWQFYRPFRLKKALTPALITLILVFVALNSIEMSDYSTLFKAVFQKYIVLIPLLAFFTFFLVGESPILTKIKQAKPLDYLGKISYGLYMYHFAIGNLLLGATNVIPAAYWLVKVLINLSATIFVASLSYEFVEKRIIKLASRHAN